MQYCSWTISPPLLTHFLSLILLISLDQLGVNASYPGGDGNKHSYRVAFTDTHIVLSPASSWPQKRNR